jgi:hypothetical protein
MSTDGALHNVAISVVWNDALYIDAHLTGYGLAYLTLPNENSVTDVTDETTVIITCALDGYVTSETTISAPIPAVILIGMVALVPVGKYKIYN